MRRRGAREGTIRKRKDGRWEARIGVPDQFGRTVRRSLYGSTRGEVQRAVRDLAMRADQGIAWTPSSVTMETFLRDWLNESAKPRLRPRTYEGYEQHVERHLVPALGSLKLQKLTPEHVQRLVNGLATKGLSPATIRYVRAVLRVALNEAMRYGHVTRNVATLVRLPRATRHECRVLSVDDAKALLEASKSSRLDALYTVGLAVGLRIGEALGLRWEDLDLERKTLRVSQALQRVNRETRFVQPKSDRSRLALPLPDFAVNALRSYRASQNKERLAIGPDWVDQGLVFTTPIGTPLDYSNVRKDFRKVLKEAGLPMMRLHDLRHTCASLLLAQGVNPRVVMATLGHSQISLTLDTYSHVLPSVHKEAAQRMNDVLAG
jgi:integrase